MSELDEPCIANYKALILPFPLSLSEEVAAKLARYVERGGNLISEAGAGPHRRARLLRPRRAVAHPGASCSACARQASPWCASRTEGALVAAERTWGEYLERGHAGRRGPAGRGNRCAPTSTWRPSSCQGSEPVLRYGDAVAGAVREVGQGRAWLLGTYVGHSGTAYRDAETTAGVRALLAACGVAPTPGPACSCASASSPARRPGSSPTPPTRK